MPNNGQLAIIVQLISIVTFIGCALAFMYRIGALIEHIKSMVHLTRQWQEQHEKRDDERFAEVRADVLENRRTGIEILREVKANKR